MVATAVRINSLLTVGAKKKKKQNNLQAKIFKLKKSFQIYDKKVIGWHNRKICHPNAAKITLVTLGL